MYAKIPGYVYQKNNKKLRFYHHVNVDSEFRQDCQTWLGFLDQAQQQRQLLCQPFINLSLQVCASELNFYSDATKNPELGLVQFSTTVGPLVNGNLVTLTNLTQALSIWNYLQFALVFLLGVTT